MYELWREIRAALRNLMKSPGYSLVAGLTLALGIGATTAIYTVVQSVLLEPLSFPEPDRLVVIQEKNPEAGFPRFAISPLNFRDYRDMSTSFQAMAARSGTTLALAGDDGGMARQLQGQTVTSDFLRVFEVQPILGRDFTPEDDVPDAARVIILTHGLWQDLGGSEAIIGSDLRINGEPITVIGVLPADYPPPAEALVPFRLDYENIGRGAHFLIAFGRLKDGVGVEAARNDLTRVAANLAETYPDSNTGWSSIVDPLHGRVVENVKTALWVLMGAVLAVLLIACTNVANLTLARLASREREMALKSALGAGRLRLVRGQLVESMVLSLLAGTLGLVLAERGTAWLVAMNADDIPRSHAIAIDGSVLVFALLITLGTALLFGFLPAWRATRIDLSGALKEGGHGQAGDRKSLRLRAGLVLGEVALALVLLVAAGLLVRGFSRLVDVEPGFDPDPVWTAGLSLPRAAYPEPETRTAFLRRLVEEAGALPGVESASTVMPMPLSGGNYVLTMYVEGEPIPEPNKEHNANIRFVSPGYFDVLGIPIQKGRGIEANDNADTTPVIAINESAARRFWPDADPIGRRISFGRPDDEDVRWFTVVGVVGNVHHSALETTPQPAFYRSSLQDPPRFSTIVLKTSGDPVALAQPLRELVRGYDSNLPLLREQTAGDVVSASVAEPRFNMTLLTIFGALALVLASIGVFGVVSYAVAQRQKEMGVRMALGARAAEIVTLVLRQGMGPVLLGTAVGLVAALGASRLLLRSLVFDVSVTDPTTYAAVGILLLAVAVAACLVPAWRATRVDPIQVLRDE